MNNENKNPNVIMSEISLMTKSTCYFCNQEIDKLSIFSICSHKICNSCLYWRIFSNHINEFQGQNKLTIKCKCEKGYLYQELPDILTLLKEKKEVDEENAYKLKKNSNQEIIEGCQCKINPKKEGNKFSEFFCLDCLQFVCSKCKSNIKNMHFNHRVTDSRHIIRSIKDNIHDFNMKNKDMEQFQSKFDKFSERFEELIERDFNITLHKIDDLLDSVKNLREFYIKKYKEKLGNYIQTISFIKIFFLNYYKDKETYINIVEPEKNNIYKLIYLNSISQEFISMNIIHSTFIENEVIKIKKNIDNLKTSDIKLIEGEFLFEKIKKGFKIKDAFQAHQKFIGGLILTQNNNKIMTSSKDCFLRVWDPVAEKKKIQETEKMKIINLFSLKNGKILASKDKDILILELNEKKKYDISQSLSLHNDLVFGLGELEDGTIISGSKDKKIILWEEDINSKQYKMKQEIETNKEIQIITALSEFKIAFSGINDNGINILDTKTVLALKEGKMLEKIESTAYGQICELKEHKGRVNCICKLNLGYMASGGGNLEKKIDNNIYIWKPVKGGFCIEQILIDAHHADVNCIILLRDGRIASSSTDRTIKIWGVNNYRNRSDNKIEFVLEETLKEFKHGLYKMIQLEDDRIVANSSDNYLVFWNTPNIF